MSNALTMIASVAALALGVNASAALAADTAKVKSVVLVHGGFVDGSGWEGVYHLLKKDGYDVTILQNPTTSLADDVAATKRAIAAAPGRGYVALQRNGNVHWKEDDHVTQQRETRRSPLLVILADGRVRTRTRL